MRSSRRSVAATIASCKQRVSRRHKYAYMRGLTSCGIEIHKTIAVIKRDILDDLSEVNLFQKFMIIRSRGNVLYNYTPFCSIRRIS